MAIPSSKYAEDENARQTLPNGTILKWSRKNSVIYPTANVETDRSICYTNWNDPIMTKANRGFHQWQPGVSAVYPDMGTNSSEGYGYLKAAGIQQQNPQPRIENLFCGVVLSDGAGNYVWGYNPEQENCINTGGGADRRYLLDMDVNKMIFSATINAYLVSDMENIDYASNPSTTHLPNTQSITLKQLYEDPDKYYISSFTVGNCYVYGETGNDHWRTASIRPAILLHSPEHTGQFYGDAQYSVFGQFYSHGVFSYDSRNIANHPVFQGGASSMPIYNLMSSGYCIGCDDELKFEPTVYDYPSAGSQATTNALFYSYINAETWNYGASVYWAAYGARVNYNVNTSESVYTEFRFDGRRLLKGSTVLSFFASFGLYFMSESFDPDSVNLTPETLGDDNRIMLGEMSADGTTTGRWITDIDSYHGPNKDGKTSNPSYNPSGGGGGGTDGDEMDSMHTGFASSLNGCAKYYLMSPSDVRQLITDFYTRAFAGSTMSESIISCYLCGIEPSYFLATSDEKIKIPTIAQEAIFESLAKYAEITAVNNILPAGHITVPRLNNDFHDYSPYSIYEVFIPFCGWCSLPDTVAGRTIWVELHVDIRTMGGKGIVLVEGSDGGKATCAEMAMNFGATSPFAVIEAGLARQAAVTAGIQTAVGFASGVVGALSGHNALTVSGVGNAIQGCANGAMSSMTNYTQVQGKAGDTSDFANGRQCYLKVSWSKTDEVVNNSMFGHTIGYLCNEVGKLSDYKGFTVCLNPHITGIDCTDEEKEEIKRLLEDGVIL